MNDTPLLAISIAVLLGVGGQVLASWTKLPAIVFLLVLGIAAGPYGADFVHPAALGPALGEISAAFIAIILFEGALTLRPEVLKRALGPVRRLISIGAALTFLGGAVLGHYIMRLPWELSFLFSSLIIVTGPTVIAPILRRVPLSPRLHAVIKSESILIDPVGVFVAVATFQYVIGLAEPGSSWTETFIGFTARVAVGTAVGATVGFLMAAVVQLPIFHRADNEHLMNLGGIGVALAAFSLADAIQPDSGVMAVIVAGLLLAWLPIPFRSEFEKFKEHVTTLGVSILFILLSANLNVPLLLRVTWRESLLLLALIAVLRPAAVYLATLGSGLTWREKAYLSLIAPRGILAAAMASYFATELRERGLPGANRIELLVFFTIAVTVCLQGSWAQAMSRWLSVGPPEAVPDPALLSSGDPSSETCPSAP